MMSQSGTCWGTGPSQCSGTQHCSPPGEDAPCSTGVDEATEHHAQDGI